MSMWISVVSRVVLMLAGILIVGCRASPEASLPSGSASTSPTPRLTATSSIRYSPIPSPVSQSAVQAATPSVQSSPEMATSVAPAPDLEARSIDSEEPTEPVTSGAKNTTTKLEILDQPADLPIQLAYMPGAAGGGSGYIACNNVPLNSSGQTASQYTGEDRPYLYTVSDQVDIGGFISICYFNFTPGPIEEQFVDAEGRTVLTRTFTIDRPSEVDTTDFMVLPEYTSGQYTVIVKSTEGEYQTTFIVTDRLAHSAEELIFSSVRIRILGLGTNGIRPKTQEMEYVYLRDFAADEIVNLYFYEFCQPRENMGGGRFPFNGDFHFGVQIRVNNEGYVFWQIPSEVKSRLNESRGYYIIAQGTQTISDVGLDDAASLQRNEWNPSQVVPVSGKVFTSSDEDDVPPMCPVISEGVADSPPPSTARPDEGFTEEEHTYIRLMEQNGSAILIAADEVDKWSVRLPIAFDASVDELVTWTDTIRYNIERAQLIVAPSRFSEGHAQYLAAVEEIATANREARDLSTMVMGPEADAERAAAISQGLLDGMVALESALNIMDISFTYDADKLPGEEPLPSGEDTGTTN